MIVSVLSDDDIIGLNLILMFVGKNYAVELSHIALKKVEKLEKKNRTCNMTCDV